MKYNAFILISYISVAIVICMLTGCQRFNDKFYERQKETYRVQRERRERRFVELHTRARTFCNKEFTDLMQIEWCISRYIDKNTD